MDNNELERDLLFEFYDLLFSPVSGKLSSQMQSVYMGKQQNKLYHFTTIDAFYQIISSNAIRFTSSKYLNDRSEGSFLPKELSRQLNNLRNPRAAVLNSFLNPPKNEKSNVLDNAFYIFSLSKSISLPMWNYYSEGAGICIEFDRIKVMNYFRNILGKRNNKIVSMRISEKDCVYSQAELKRYVKGIVNFIEGEEGLSQNGNIFAAADMINGATHFFKDKIFDYEKEVRFIAYVDNPELAFEDYNIKYSTNDLIKFGFYNTNQTIKPCLSFSHQHEKKLPIEGIYVSPFNQSETVLDGLRFFLHSNGYPDDIPIERPPSNARRD